MVFKIIEKKFYLPHIHVFPVNCTLRRKTIKQNSFEHKIIIYGLALEKDWGPPLWFSFGEASRYLERKFVVCLLKDPDSFAAAVVVQDVLVGFIEQAYNWKHSFGNFRYKSSSCRSLFELNQIQSTPTNR